MSHQPLMATHSNVHKLCNHSRNLTNNQLKAIKESNGIVGLNFVTGFLRSDGQMNENTDLEITQINLNDNTIEGLANKDSSVIAVQYHPEASPGPHDTHEFFDKFIEILSK